jgi:hypothetical protein
LGGAQSNQLMNAVNLTGPNTWRITAVGDFNGDGYPDTIWQDPATGTSQVWYLGGSDGSTILNIVGLSGANTWRIAGPR